MKAPLSTSAACLLAGLGAISSAQAGEVMVTSNIAVSETWTADNTYNLQKQIYVEPGATLTIEAGVVVASTTGLGGSLAIARGAQIIVQGTAGAPVIMTSKADVTTWTPDGGHPTGGDPSTGTWREAANEWGNLTLMGTGFISENATSGNIPVPDAGNVAAMEGLIEDFPGDPKVLYGGGDDDDDSGSLSYLSIRYGGKVIGLNNELNGLSLGGLGRGTDIDHIEIMNNVDDGIEIWGGTVNLKHVSIWNVGDDSFDIDQGWRGKAQFGLIVQGHSADASQGSGVGDNCIEMDGAEDSDWQPVTTGALYNFTVIGQPVDGDGATTWRDNARMQIRNSVFVDCGEKVVRFDDVDGDGANGYGHNGTLDWATTWTTDWNNFSSVNAPANPGDFYKTQIDGKLIEITDSVFFRNLASNAYDEANARNVFDAANDNVLIPGFDDIDSPLTTLSRGGPVVKGGKTILPVTFLDPRPQNEATVSVSMAPADGFFTQAPYRGAFAPGSVPAWTCAWTASDAFGLTAGDCVGQNYCDSVPNSSQLVGVITAAGSTAVIDNSLTLYASQLPFGEFGMLIVSQSQGSVQPPGSSGTLCVVGNIGRYTAHIGSSGSTGTLEVPVDLTSVPVSPNASVQPGETWNWQFWHRDGATSNFTNAVSVTFN